MYSIQICVIYMNLSPAHGEMYSIQPHVIAFFRNLPRDGGVLCILQSLQKGIIMATTIVW